MANTPAHPSRARPGRSGMIPQRSGGEPLKKRLSFLLAILLMLSCAVTAEASADHAPSEAILGVIANQEGFRAYEHSAGGYTYIGYGTQVRAGTYPDGISREAAMALLRKSVSAYAALLNGYLRRSGVSVTQNQFDALLSLTHNLGSRWMNSRYTLSGYLLAGIDRYSDAEVVNAFGSWCHAGGRILPGLAVRRIQEARIFLYGDYGLFNYSYYCAGGAEEKSVEAEVEELDALETALTDAAADAAAIENETEALTEAIDLQTGEAEAEAQTGPSYPNGQAVEFTYVLFRADAGTVESDIVYYVKGEPYGEFPSAARSGYALNGWKTADGAYLKPSARAAGIRTVTAAWTTGTPNRSNLTVSPFADVSVRAWYYEAVASLSAAGVIGGYASGAFRPGDKVSCGAALKLLLLAAGYDEQAPAGESAFSGYAALALQKGFLDPDEIPSLSAPASRLLVARLTARVMGLAPSAAPSPYADTDDAYAAALYAAGVMTGSAQGGTTVLKASDGIRRSEMAVVLSRMLACSAQGK